MAPVRKSTPVRRGSTPDIRASAAKTHVERVRRRYSPNTRRNNSLLKVEIPYVKSMVAVLKLAGYSGRQISLVVGISRDQVASMLADPEVIEQIVTMRQRLPAAALELLQGYMVEAVQALVDIMRSSQDDKSVLNAATEILDRAGIPKASRQERHNVNEERTTFADEGIVERLRQASPEVQEEAATIIERLESLLGQAAEAAMISEEGDEE